MPLERYRPANGTEGMRFIEKWCDRCQMIGTEHESCPILLDSMVYEVDVSEYPSEFRMGKNGPICTAFKEVPPPDYKNPKQKQLL